jgi:ADP-ribosyl-[dinitrogen reductase] hydrolase
MRGLVDKTEALLNGIAVGDAFGKMTEGYWPPEIITRYGGPIQEFRDPIQPNSRYSWRRAEVTDDTGLTLIVARSIVEREGVDESHLINSLCSEEVKGWPSWDRLVEAVQQGVRMTRVGNGGPIRVAGAGIINTMRSIDSLVKDAEHVVRCSHNSRSAVAASSAMAAAFSAALEDLEPEDILQASIRAAKHSEDSGLGEEDHCPTVSRRLEWVRQTVSQGSDIEELRKFGLNPGFTAWEGVSAAMAIFISQRHAGQAAICAAGLGGDADCVGSMAAGLSACYNPSTLPHGWVRLVHDANDLGDIGTLAERLVELRERNEAGDRWSCRTGG